MMSKARVFVAAVLVAGVASTGFASSASAAPVTEKQYYAKFTKSVTGWVKSHESDALLMKYVGKATKGSKTETETMTMFMNPDGSGYGNINSAGTKAEFKCPTATLCYVRNEGMDWVKTSQSPIQNRQALLSSTVRKVPPVGKAKYDITGSMFTMTDDSGYSSTKVSPKAMYGKNEGSLNGADIVMIADITAVAPQKVTAPK